MSLNLGRRRGSGESPIKSSLETSNGVECLDHQLLKNLADLVEKITTTGRPSLDEGLMKQIKKICKTSDAYVEHAYHLVITQLHMGHSEIRLSAFQVIDELFNRSHHLRELLVTDMQEFMEYCVETDPDSPLPPPKAAAKRLKESAIRAIQQWQNKYGQAYKKLTLGYNFLKFQKNINFENIEARSAVERRRIVEREKRKQLAEQQKVIKILQKMQEKMPEIEQTLTQVENCFELLLPRQTILVEDEPSDSEEDEEEVDADDETNCDQKDSPIPNRTSSRTSPGADKDNGSLLNGIVNSTSNTKDDRTSGMPNIRAQDVASEIKQEIDNDCADVSHGQNTTVAIKQESGTSNVGVQITNDIVTKRVDNGQAASSTNQVESQDSVMESDEVGNGSESALRQHHGLPSRDYNLTIRLNTAGVQMNVNEDNQDILNNLDDHHKLITGRFLPEIALWMMTLGKTPQQQDRLKKCIDVKQALKAATEKYRELRLQRNLSSFQQPSVPFDDVESSDSDEEFEDVPEKEGYEPFIPEHLRAEYGLEPLASSSSSSSTLNKASIATKPKPAKRKTAPAKKPQAKKPAPQTGLVYSKNRKWHPLMETEHTVSDPTSQAGTMADMISKAKNIKTASPTKSNSQSDPTKKPLVSKAPVVPFGVDLEHWENPEDIPAPTILRPDADHLIWSAGYTDEELVLENAKSKLQTRVISYAGSFTPVKWKCRAPLPSGILCDRMDRVKCPFHGKIIGRDNDGIPTNPEDLERAIKQAGQEQPGPSTSSPFDIGLQQDVEAALGLDLGSSNPNLGDSGKGKGRGKKKGKGKAKKYPNLTDIKKVKNTSRMRLERKVMNKNALSRVANAMTRMDNKLMNDKFSNNFTSLK